MCHVWFFVVGGRLLLFRTKFGSIRISEAQSTRFGTSHVALTVVHPAKGAGEDEDDNDNSSDEATHVLLDFSAGRGRVRTVFSSAHEEFSGSLGLADGASESSVSISFVDPAALVVVGGLEAFILGGGIAEGTDTEVGACVEGAETVVAFASSLSGEGWASVLLTFTASPDAAFDGSAEFFLRSGTFRLGTSREESAVPLAGFVGGTSVLSSFGDIRWVCKSLRHHPTCSCRCSRYKFRRRRNRRDA